MAFPLTDQQRAVVDDRGGCLLVSAAAGSGKTRVLVERLLTLIGRQPVESQSIPVKLVVRESSLRR